MVALMIYLAAALYETALSLDFIHSLVVAMCRQRFRGLRPRRRQWRKQEVRSNRSLHPNHPARTE